MSPLLHVARVALIALAFTVLAVRQRKYTYEDSPAELAWLPDFFMLWLLMYCATDSVFALLSEAISDATFHAILTFAERVLS